MRVELRGARARGVEKWYSETVFQLHRTDQLALGLRFEFAAEPVKREADTEAAGRAVDSLLNFETVKSFAAEARESERYDRALASYARAAVRAYTSRRWGATA